MIQFLNITKSYDVRNDELIAVENISFEIEDGEFIFLIGPSGSGKTTLIKLLIREELPTSGNIYFDNEDVTKFGRRQIYKLRRKIGVIFQDYKLIEDKTTYENIGFVMEAAGKSDAEIKETVPHLLDIVGLVDRSYSFPMELSGGEKQRIAIARSLANNPKLLIADEPTGNLDPESAWEVVQILKKVNDWGTTVIMATHGSDIVDKINKRVIQMNNGLLVRDDTTSTYESATQSSQQVFEDKFTKSKDYTTSEQTDISPSDTMGKTKSINQKTKPKDSKTPDTTDKNHSQILNTKSEKNKKKNKFRKQKQKKETVVKNKKLKISLVHRKGTKKIVEKKSRPKGSKDKPIYILDMPSKLINILEVNNFKTVESLVNAGIEEISKIEALDKIDIKMIKKSLLTYIRSE